MVLLGGTAPTTPPVVSLAASGASVPGTVTIPAGYNSASFSATPSVTGYSVMATAPGFTSLGPAAGSASAASNLVAGTLSAVPSYVSAALSLAGASGGVSPLSIQFQRAPDANGSPGAWVNVGTSGTGTTCTASGLTPATKAWFRALVQDSTSPAPLVAATAPIPSTTMAATVGSATPPSIGPVQVRNTDTRESVSYSAPVAGSYPIAKVELFIISATAGGDASSPVAVADDVTCGGSLPPVCPRNNHQYVVRVSDTATPPRTALSNFVTGGPARGPIRNFANRP